MSDEVRAERFRYDEGDVEFVGTIDLSKLKGTDDHWKRDAEWFSEGGPGSGHHGHRGIPGYRGGSIPQGPIHFKWRDWDAADIRHMQAYAEKRSEEWLSELHWTEEQAVGRYTAGSSKVNGCLRDGYDCDLVQKDIDELTLALDVSSVQEDTVVYRGIRAAHVPVKPGDSFRDNSFTSTSLNPGIAHEFSAVHADGVVCRITVPKGTRAGYVQKQSNYDDEVELLIQRGTAYKFNGVSTILDGDGNEVEVFDLEVVGQLDVTEY